MSGISGIYSSKDIVSDNVFKNMVNIMRHRGPDDKGYFVDNNIKLGHRRLSIIDLETGRQPVHNEDESIWVVFNGEIYNYKKLREELIGKGHDFYTESDAEVLVHLYEEYKEEFVKKIDGQFAIALWDSNWKKLLLVRDRFGIKPIYYYNKNGNFIFASEIKSILESGLVKKGLDFDSLYQYFSYSFVPAPQTMFKNVWKLPAGYILKLEKGNIEIKRYWDINFGSRKHNENYVEKKILSLLKNAVRKRLMSDVVPLGAFLSGGVDSSLVVALMSEYVEDHIETFSVGYNEEEYSELKYAKLVSEKYNTNHHELIVDHNDFVSALPKFIWHEDEPSVGGVVFYLLSKSVGKNIKVSMCGEGGDELFAGYYAYYWYTVGRFNVFKNLNFLPDFLQNKLSIIYKNIRKNEYEDITEIYFGSASTSGFDNEEKNKILVDNKAKNNYDNYKISKNYEDDLHQMMYIDFKTWLPDSLLMNEDKLGMASSIECRVPFLDIDLVEFSSTLENRYRIRGKEQKYIIKKIAKNFIPKDCINRPKMGFSTPIPKWFKDDIYDTISKILLESVDERKYFKKDFIKKILEEHRKGIKDNHHKIWLFLNLELWHRVYIDNDFHNISEVTMGKIL